jgi:RNA polymerase primary sigma factor
MRQLKIVKQVTNRESKSLDKYLQDISKIDLINAQEEVELAQRIKAGDAVALERLTTANQGLTLPDLINEGNVGLVKAAKRFDETRGFKFISYAVWWIRQAILQALAEQARIVRLPLNKIGSINKINKAFSYLEQAHQRPPSPEEIAKELEMTVSDVKQSLKNSGRHVSMDAPLIDGENSSLYDVLDYGDSPRPDQALIQSSLHTEITRALDTLSPREADVIKLFYGIGEQPPMTLAEIGLTFDLTRERVRQIREKAIRKLRHSSKNKLLKTYLG